MVERQSWRRASVALLVVVAACATRSYRVQQEFVPALFQDLLTGVALADEADFRPRFEAIWELLGDGQLSRAASAIDRLPTLTPHPVHVARGALLLTAGEVEGGIAEFDQALAVAPRYPGAMLGKAVGMHLLGDDRAADALLDRLVEIDPGNRSAGRVRSRVRVRWLESSLARATAAESRGDVASALRELEDVAKLDPRNLELRLRMGRLAASVGDYAAARDFFRGATELQPNSAEAWVGVGDATLKGGEPAVARDAFERASTLPGGMELARERVGRLRDAESLEREGDPELALIVSSPTLDRAGLATLFRARISRLERIPPRGGALVITDIARSRGRRAIQELVGMEVLEVYENHTFRPDVQVNRAMLAGASARVLMRFREAGWLAERPSVVVVAADIPPEHVHFHDVTEVARYELMEIDSDGLFHPFEPVGGAEADAVARRLSTLLR